MTNKIFSIFALLLCLATSAKAATEAPDSVFVVKGGRITSAYEVGKDIDNITMPFAASLADNSVKMGDETTAMKSAVTMRRDGYLYVYLSSQEGVTSTSQLTTGKVMQLVMSESLANEDITLSTFAEAHGEDGAYLQLTYMDMDAYASDDNYEPFSFTSDDWNEAFSDGTISVSVDNGQLSFRADMQPLANAASFAALYAGACTEMAQSANYFTVDGARKDLRAAFAEQVADGVAFYLTPGNITKATELENTYYYVRLFVPTAEMDGSDIDINGNREYELTFVDNATDINNPQTISLANGMTGSATGSLSVLDRGDGSYTITIDIQNMGKDGDRSLQVAYVKSTPADYDLTIPSTYSVADGDDIALKSASISHNATASTYTIYLSSKASVTGAADADIAITVPDSFVNDEMVHGFSGSDVNAQIAITYGGDTFSQANTGNKAGAIAAGGNARLSFASGYASVDFTVFGISKYGGSLKGHYEGNATGAANAPLKQRAKATATSEEQTVNLNKGEQTIQSVKLAADDYIAFGRPEGVEEQPNVEVVSTEVGKNYVTYKVVTREKDKMFQHLLIKKSFAELLATQYFGAFDENDASTMKSLFEMLIQAGYGFTATGSQTFTVRDGEKDAAGEVNYIPGGQDYYLVTSGVSVSGSTASLDGDLHYTKLHTKEPGESKETINVEFKGFNSDGNAWFDVQPSEGINNMHIVLATAKSIDEFLNVYGYDYLMFTQDQAFTREQWTTLTDDEHTWNIEREGDYSFLVLGIDNNGDWVKASLENIHIKPSAGNDCPVVDVPNHQCVDGELAVQFQITSKASSINSARMLVMKEKEWDDALNKYAYERPSLAWAEYMATTDKAQDVTDAIRQLGNTLTYKRTFTEDERGWYVVVLAVTDDYGTTVTRASFHTHLADAEWDILSHTYPVEK